MGPGWCFFINGVSFAAILLAILSIRTDISHRGEANGTVWGGLIEGLGLLRRDRRLRGVVALTAVTSLFAFSFFSTLMPAYAKDLLGIAEHDRRYGLLFSAIGVGSLCGVYFVGRFALAEKRGLLLMAGALVYAGALLVAAHVVYFALAVALCILAGMAAISQLATANALTQSLAPEGLRGRAVSMHMFAMAGLQPFGAMLAGTLAQSLGVSAALSLGAGIFLAFTLTVWFLRPEVSRLA
jgi:MFS family permease